MITALPWTRHRLGLGLLTLALLLGLLILAAPATSRLESGSTWHRGPAGYSAWYASLAQRGVAVQRWQRPLEELLQRLKEAPTTTLTQGQPSPASPATLLVVLPGFVDESELPAWLPWLPDWLKAGHRLVVLGVKVPVTAAPFSQTLASPVGAVTIETRRRYELSPNQEEVLDDAYGTVIWRSQGSRGELILAATPHLAANAYQAQPGNFALLTELVTTGGGQVWIDEYLHGYRDEAAIAAEAGGDRWWQYLARTPLLIVAVQALAVTLLALVAFNRRLGQRQRLRSIGVDNSQAYIQALAAVLRKAGSHDFVVQTLSQAERLTLQKALGLGNKPLPVDQLQAAWQQQMGGAVPGLTAILHPPRPQAERQLRDWLQRVQSLQALTQEIPAGHE